jgi:hypothetical protein
MADPRIVYYKRINPYDLGEVARVSREYREGRCGPRFNEPYIPPRPPQDRTTSAVPGDSDEPADKTKP